MKWHRHWNKLYYGCALLSYPIIFFLIYKKVVPLLAVVLMLDLFFGCLASWITKQCQKREMAMLGLMQECRLSEFIDQYGKAHAKDTKNGFSAASALNLATAYMHMGEMETAMKLFQQAEPKKPQQFSKRKRTAVSNAIVECAVYHNNLAAAYLHCHDTEHAEIHMEETWEYLEQLKRHAGKHPELEDSIDIIFRGLLTRKLERALELHEELDCEEEIKKLQAWFERSDQLLIKVYNRYLLSILYEKCGNREEAGHCKAFVGQYGGDSCYVKWVED